MLWGYRLVGFASLVANGATLALVGTPETPSRSAMASPMPRLPEANSATVNRFDDGLFHLTGRTDGGRAEFVVDTGASVTVLTASDAARLGARALPTAARMMLQTVGGRTAMRWQRLPALSIAGQRLPALDVAVVDRGLNRSLLGQDVLSRLGTIIIADDQITIRRSPD